MSLREIAKILGIPAFSVQAIPFAQGHYRALQRLYKVQSMRANMDLSMQVVPDTEASSVLVVAEYNKFNGSG